MVTSTIRKVFLGLKLSNGNINQYNKFYCGNIFYSTMANKRKRYSSSDEEMESCQSSPSGSSDEDEDIPLQLIKNGSNNGNSVKNLYDSNLESCEFCDLIFYNKYDILIHTARHIIIPVEKLELHQCSECFYHFTTIEELHFHLATKHNITVVPGILECIVIKQPIIRCDNTVTELLKANIERDNVKESNKHNIKSCIGQANSKVNKDIGNIENEEQCNIETSKNRSSQDSADGNHIQNSNEKGIKGNVKTTNQTNHMKSRLVFEDDLDDNIDVMTNIDKLTASCIVNVNKFPFYDIERDDKTEIEPCRGKIVLGNKAEKCDGVTAMSVHYDELMMPGLYRCKRCCKTFPNRFGAIVHETMHLKIKKRLPPFCCTCDRYIAGNYKNLANHMERQHPNTPKRKYTLSSCRKCGLKYNNYYRHIKNYHLIYVCHLCGKHFETDEERIEHRREHYGQGNKLIVGEKVGTYDKVATYLDGKILKICELCALFMKGREGLRYVCVGEYSKVGERQTCEKCKKDFFEVKLVKPVRRIKETENTYKKHSLIGNENKLKSFQKRLQMLNKLTRI